MPVLADSISKPTSARRGIFGIYAGLITLNLIAWGWALVLFHDQPLLLGAALLAYGFGLRHAVDADHIAAIDNVTRKLRQDGRRPLTVGLFFALGHSSVVVLASALIALSTSALKDRFEAFKEIGGLIGTSVSAAFLFLIAAMNFMILVSVWRTWRHVRAGGAYDECDLDLLLNSRGLLARLFRPLFALIGRSWHMLPLGFLFGLGFDTATEVAVLGISASQAAHSMPIWAIMVFPALFTAGMTLVDTTDGILMLRAYDWAFVKPVRKLYYNMTITAVSVLVAVLVGGIETLGLVADRIHGEGRFWDAIGFLNDDFSTLGFIVIGVFIAAWIGSVLMYRYKGLDALELQAEARSAG